MKVEVPELKRCCFFIPLRLGLLLSGYLKMALSIFLATHMILTLVRVTRDSFTLQYYLKDIILLSILTACVILDVCFNLIFVVGSHMKAIRPLRIFYICCIVIMCIYGLFFLWITVNYLYDLAITSMYLDNRIAHEHFYRELRAYAGLGILLFGFHTYMIVATKSEIEKLRTSTKNPLRNAAMDGQSTVENGSTESTGRIED